MRHSLVLSSVVLCLRVYSAAADDIDVTMEGGGSSIEANDRYAFDTVSPATTDPQELERHDTGQSGFLRRFVGEGGGLGPQFNSDSCGSCHVRGGRGQGAFGRSRSDVIVKASGRRGAADVPGGPVPVVGLGTQLHDHSVHGAAPDAKLRLRWSVATGVYPDGTAYELRRPKVRVRLSQRRVLPRGTLLSLRQSPSIVGAGLLDAVSDETIFQMANRQATSGGSVSGRPNVVWDYATRSSKIGRFGLKASHPSLRQQIAAAYVNDMGVVTPLVRPSGARVELKWSALNDVVFYLSSLAVPKARNQNDPQVARGRGLFQRVGCSECHVMSLETSDSSVEGLAHQTIHPMTDLLLHDMGAGLADDRGDFAATGSEWRTRPLWGLGLSDVVLGARASYLHDGRARTLEEAILWHGGEAAQSNLAFQHLSADERGDLIVFLGSL